MIIPTAGSCRDLVCGHQACTHSNGLCDWPGCKCVGFLTCFTPREYEILLLLAKGGRIKAIARAMNLSPKTIGSHFDHIFKKTGANTQMEVILGMLRCHLIELDDLPPLKVRIESVKGLSR